MLKNMPPAAQTDAALQGRRTPIGRLWRRRQADPERVGVATARWSRRLLRTIGPVLFVVIWWTFDRIGVFNPLFLPSPVTIGHRLVTWIGNGVWERNVLVSARRAVEGLLLGAGAGVLVGCLSGMSQLFEDLSDPVVQMLRTVPFIALSPLLIIWFGIGETPKIALVIVATFFPLYLNTFNGIRNVDARLVEAARGFGLGGLGLVRQVIIPGALPQILVGLRLAMGFSWLALVVAEQINANSGIGFLLTTSQNSFDTTGVVAAVATYAFMGIVTDAIVRLLEGRLLRWRLAYTGS